MDRWGIVWPHWHHLRAAPMMRDAVLMDKAEASTLKLSEAARAALINATFDGEVWSLSLQPIHVFKELLGAKAARGLLNGVALTTKGMSLRAMAVRIAHRQRVPSTIAPDLRAEERCR